MSFCRIQAKSECLDSNLWEGGQILYKLQFKSSAYFKWIALFALK